MAQGDIRVEITDIAASTWLSVQPPANEHWLVIDFFSSGDGTNVGVLRYTDGTDEGNNLEGDTAAGDFVSYRAKNPANELKLGITNSLYVKVYNRDTNTRKCGITALQIK